MPGLGAMAKTVSIPAIQEFTLTGVAGGKAYERAQQTLTQLTLSQRGS